MKLRSCLTLCLAVSAVLVSVRTTNADDDDWWRRLPVKAVRVVVHTEDDNKDSEESVKLTVSYGPLSSETTVGQGEEWSDQTDRTFDIALPDPHPPAGATFELRVSKSRQGSRTGHGWNASFEMFALLEQGGQMQLYINGDRNSPRSARFVMGDGEQNPNDVVVMPNAKAVALAGARSISRTRLTVRFNPIQ